MVKSVGGDNMPYNIINPGSVEDAWNNPQSVFNQERNNDRQTQAVQQGLLNQTLQNYGNAVQNVVEEPTQPVVPTAATQMASQGNTVARRKPTAAEYEAGVINYLVNNRGYSYEDAQQLMAPRIQAYKVQEAAENRNMAYNLIAEMQNMKIDSPEYRQAAFQLYRLDPQMGTFMLKEGISPREQYLQDRSRQNKREDLQYNADFQLRNQLQRMQAAEEYKQRLVQEKVNQLVNQGGYTPQQAWAMVYGMGRRGNTATANADGGMVSEKDYKMVTGRLKELLAKQDEGMLTNPNYRLSADEQDEFNRLSQIANLARRQLYDKYGIGQQQKQPVKINPNDYNSVGPFIQWAVEQNKGFTPELARAIRAKLGFNPDDNSQNNFVNQIFKSHYDFSG